MAGTSDHDGRYTQLIAWMFRYVDDMRIKGYSAHSLVGVRCYVLLFCEWAFHRDVHRPVEVTKDLLERYQRSLFYLRKADGNTLTLSSQRVRLQKVRSYFKWLAKHDVIPFNPASELELPRLERRLPRAVFSEKEVEQVLAMPDLTDAVGIRDRTMMEVLYSTGIRRTELAMLSTGDIDAERGTVTVRQGKGRKDRVVPVGERAPLWVGRYVEEVRSFHVVPPGHTTLFVSEAGRPLKPARLTQLMTRYVNEAGLGKTGACHVFRHTMATLTHPGANLGGLPDSGPMPAPEPTAESVLAVLEDEAREENRALKPG